MNHLEDLYQLQAGYEKRAQEAQAKAAHAMARLLDIAETDTGQARRVRSFLAAAFNAEGHSFNLFDLRALDVEISDDVLVTMDALRWGRSDLYRLLPDGYERMTQLVETWGLGRAFAVKPE